MKTYKELFEDSYGDDSFNDDFLIDAISAESIHQKSLVSYRDKLDEIIDVVQMFKQDMGINPLSADYDSLNSIMDFVIDNTSTLFK